MIKEAIWIRKTTRKPTVNRDKGILWSHVWNNLHAIWRPEHDQHLVKAGSRR